MTKNSMTLSILPWMPLLPWNDIDTDKHGRAAFKQCDTLAETIKAIPLSSIQETNRMMCPWIFLVDLKCLFCGFLCINHSTKFKQRKSKHAIYVILSFILWQNLLTETKVTSILNKNRKKTPNCWSKHNSKWTESKAGKEPVQQGLEIDQADPCKNIALVPVSVMPDPLRNLSTAT